MSTVRTWHNVYDTHHHIVFPVKYRKALLINEVPLAISQIAKEIQMRYDIEFEKIGLDLNHIHLLASFPPKLSGSDVVAHALKA
jgi:putative transposase